MPNHFSTPSRVKRIYSFLLFSILASWALDVRASHVAGSRIEYRHLSADSFEVKLIFYRDCDGILPPPSINLQLKCSQSSTLHIVGVPLQLIGEVSQVCPSYIDQTACNNGNVEGIQLYVGTTIVDFSQYSPTACNFWTLAWSINARNVSINGSYTPMHAEATLNNLDFPTNSSPTYSDYVIPYMFPAGAYLDYEISASDRDGDSLVYTLAPAMSDFSTLMTYQSGYSGANPMPPLVLDSQTGRVSVQGVPPVTGGEDNYVVVYRVDEYDRSTGILKGMSITDLNAIVFGDANHVPELLSTAFVNVLGATILDSFHLGVVAGQQFCFKVTYSDSNLTDSLFVSANFGDFASNVTIAQTGVNPTTADVCVTMNDMPNFESEIDFLISARDNHCPNYNVTSKTLKLSVISLGQLDDEFMCYGDTTSIAVAGSQVNWSVVSGPPMVVGVNVDCDTCVTMNVFPDTTTTYAVTFYLNGLGLVTDTVTVSVGPEIAASLSGTVEMCATETAVFTAQTVSSNAQISWSTPGGVFTSNGFDTVWVDYPNSGNFLVYATVTDSACSQTVGSSIAVNANPNVVASNDEMICSSQSTGISASGAITYQWLPSTALSNPSIANPIANPFTTTQYTVTGTDTNGCVGEDQVTIVVQPTYLNGRAIKANGDPIFNGQVKMIKYLAGPDSVYTLDVTTADSLGDFQFLVTHDSIFVQTIPIDSLYPDFMPTYYKKEAVIHNSNLFLIVPCAVNTITIKSAPVKQLGGQGYLGGRVKYVGTNTAVPSLSMVLRDSWGTHIDQEYTDSNGYFRFEGLTNGTYYFDVDSWPIQNSLAPSIDLLTGESRDNLRFVLHPTFLTMKWPTGLSESSETHISAYPNPSQGMVTIRGLTASASVTLIGLDGTIVRTAQVAAQEGTMNLQGLSAGSYILEVEGEDGFLRQLLIVE